MWKTGDRVRFEFDNFGNTESIEGTVVNFRFVSHKIEVHLDVINRIEFVTLPCGAFNYEIIHNPESERIDGKTLFQKRCEAGYRAITGG